uniref:Putative secreted peptide n=1 Tax=Anopheles braziliensis TaxID=58242 RepID=A0A2M3ZUR9_9DIPT
MPHFHRPPVHHVSVCASKRWLYWLVVGARAAHACRVPSRSVHPLPSPARRAWRSRSSMSFPSNPVSSTTPSDCFSGGNFPLFSSPPFHRLVVGGLASVDNCP